MVRYGETLTRTSFSGKGQIVLNRVRGRGAIPAVLKKAVGCEVFRMGAASELRQLWKSCGGSQQKGNRGRSGRGDDENGSWETRVLRIRAAALSKNQHSGEQAGHAPGDRAPPMTSRKQQSDGGRGERRRREIVHYSSHNAKSRRARVGRQSSRKKLLKKKNLKPRG